MGGKNWVLGWARQRNMDISGAGKRRLGGKSLGDRETTFRPQADASTDTLASSGRARGNSIYFHANNLNES